MPWCVGCWLGWPRELGPFVVMCRKTRWERGWPLHEVLGVLGRMHGGVDRKLRERWQGAFEAGASTLASGKSLAFSAWWDGVKLVDRDALSRAGRGMKPGVCKCAQCTSAAGSWLFSGSGVERKRGIHRKFVHVSNGYKYRSGGGGPGTPLLKGRIRPTARCRTHWFSTTEVSAPRGRCCLPAGLALA
jgi:hypothetical protein